MYEIKGVENMDAKTITTSLESGLNAFHLPRSRELPDIDFYMDQVVSIIEKQLSHLSLEGSNKVITPAMINNYVKLGIIPPPRKKRYGKDHLCYLFIICALKAVMPIPAISQMIKVQTKQRTVYELYDIFCEAYENMLKEAVQTSGEILLEETESIEDSLAKLSLFMAINASTTQLIADSVIKSFSDEKTETKE
jgi:DNA-binding transcriptional MerR regulator